MIIFFSNDKITHIVYLHSFTDAQLLYGFDGFLNVYEWIQFTIKELIKNKKNKILIKAHPIIFHTKFPTNLIKYDQKICNQLLLEYSNVKNVNFIIKPIKNIDILKILTKNVYLSHTMDLQYLKVYIVDLSVYPPKQLFGIKNIG